MNMKSDNEKRIINKKRIQNRTITNNVSKASINFFQRLEEYIAYELIYGNKKDELKILYDNVHYFYYDCFLPSLNVIIEYHGTRYHPKPLQYDWVGIHGHSYRKARLHDLRKKRAAKDRGYHYIEVWDDEDVNKAIQRILAEIEWKIC